MASPRATLFVTLAQYSRAESAVSGLHSMDCAFSRSRADSTGALRFETQNKAPRRTAC